MCLGLRSFRSRKPTTLKMTRFRAMFFAASTYSVLASSGDGVRTIRLGMDTNYPPYAMAGEPWTRPLPNSHRDLYATIQFAR